MDRGILGVVGAVIAAGAAIYYIYDIVNGTTRPHRVSWGVWALIAILGASSAIEGGAGAGAYVSLVYVGLTVIVFLLSLVPRYGKPGGESYDWPLGLAAAGTIVAWQVFGLPVTIAAVVAVVADAIAAWPTLRESYRQPHTESLPVWTADAVAAALGVAAVAKYNFASLAFPVYLLVAQGLIATILFARRKIRIEGDRR